MLITRKHTDYYVHTLFMELSQNPNNRAISCSIPRRVVSTPHTNSRLHPLSGTGHTASGCLEYLAKPLVIGFT